MSDIRVTIQDQNGAEYHITLSAQEVRDILDPEVPDRYIPIPVPAELKGSVRQQFLHSSRAARLWLHDELPKED